MVSAMDFSSSGGTLASRSKTNFPHMPHTVSSLTTASDRLAKSDPPPCGPFQHDRPLGRSSSDYCFVGKGIRQCQEQKTSSGGRPHSGWIHPRIKGTAILIVISLHRAILHKCVPVACGLSRTAFSSVVDDFRVFDVVIGQP